MNSRRIDLPRESRLGLSVFLSFVILPAFPWPAGVYAQSGLLKGTADTFEAATWNIEWFGGPNGPTDDARQVANVTTIIEQADIDLWALQEIASESAFNTVLANLGGAYGGHLAPTSAQQSLGLAFIYKKDVVQVRRVQEVLTSFEDDFAGRPPFQLEANLTIGETTLTVTFIVVHMKATSDAESYAQRQAGSLRLKNHIDFTGLGDEPVILLGDLNDLLSGSITGGQPSPYQNFVDDPNYATPTGAFHLDGRNTFCTSSGCLSGSAIDHIIISNEAEPWYVINSADHFDEVIQEITQYVTTTSDHLPVLAAFDLTSTDLESTPEIPNGLRLSATYPNPFGENIHVEFEIDRGGGVEVTVSDMLGRLVAHRHEHLLLPGQHRLTLSAGTLARGPYLVRVSAGGGRVASRLVSRL